MYLCAKDKGKEVIWGRKGTSLRSRKPRPGLNSAPY